MVSLQQGTQLRRASVSGASRARQDRRGARAGRGRGAPAGRSLALVAVPPTPGKERCPVLGGPWVVIGPVMYAVRICAVLVYMRILN